MSHPFHPLDSGGEERTEMMFFRALKQHPDERAAFLEAECSGKPQLRAEVEAMLRDHAGAGTFLSADGLLSPALEAELALNSPEQAGGIIGPYKLRQQIGEGGFGTVWMAEQEKPVRRRVALKIIKLGMDTKEVVARFEQERQALAMMDHPNIAKVLDAGATPLGRPFFVMELVRGIKITDYCNQANLPVIERLKLFMQVCHAVQHAHQKGIIHRDLKPSNILVTLHDGTPVPKVIDFGVAKATDHQRLTEQTVLTRFEQMIGTPAYMSPEQAEMSGLDIDTRSDIYSLGVLLYELLTGTPPFNARELLKAGLDEMRRTIRETEPPKPSTRLSQSLTVPAAGKIPERSEGGGRKSAIDPDLDWIVMKALEKDRSRRYETANGLAADIQRHLASEPVTARPPSAGYRFRRLVKRNKAAVVSSTAILVALLTGLGAALWMYLKEKDARERAVAAEEEQSRLRSLAEAQEKKASNEASKNEQVSQFLSDMISGMVSSVAGGRDKTMLLDILDRTAKRAAGDLKDVPEIVARLRFTTATVYIEMGDFKTATGLLRESLETARAVWGDNHQHVASILEKLSFVFLQTGNPVEAETLQREALGILRKRLGEEHPSVTSALNNMGLVFLGRKKLTEAESVYREALAMNRKLLGDEHQEVAASLSGLADVFSARDKLTEAESLYREALAMQKKLLGDDHIKVAFTLGNLALVLDRLNKSAEAESMHREALTIRIKRYGREHPDVATCLNNLALTLGEQGRLAEAESMAREAVAMRRKLLGTESSAVGVSLNNLGQVLWNAGKLEEAEAVLHEALELKRKHHRDANETTAVSLQNLGGVLIDQGQPDEAEKMLREALVMRQTLYGKEHRLVASSLNNLANSLHKQLRFTEAETMHREALAMKIKLEGEASQGVAESLGNLAVVLSEQGRYPEAEAMHREALATFRKLRGNDHSTAVISLIRLGVVLRKQHKSNEAEATLREALSLARKLFGDVHPHVAYCLRELGQLLKLQGKPSEAESMYREELEIRRKCHGTENPEVAQTLHNLAHALQDRGDATGAVKVFREAVDLHRKLFGNEHLKVGEILVCLGKAFEAGGDADEAARVFREALEIKRKRLGSEHSDVAAAAAGLALRLIESGNFADAEPVARESLTIREKLMPDDWLTFNSRSLLGASLIGQKKHAEAGPLLLSGYEGMKQREDTIPANARIRLRQGIERIVRFYEETGVPEQAAEWRKKLAEFENAVPKSMGRPGVKNGEGKQNEPPRK